VANASVNKKSKDKKETLSTRHHESFAY